MGNVGRHAPSLGFGEDQLALVRDAMFGVVNQGGTGGAARLEVPGVTLAAKTGTAQVRRITMAERNSGVLKNGQLPFKLRDHALFICFAPADKPRYAAAVVLEHNGHVIRNLDTPLIGRDIMTYLFDRNRALATLAEVEPTWGGDIRTRMATEAAAYRAAQAGISAGAAAATETDADAATDAPAVTAASEASNATASALSSNSGVAADGTTESTP
jgi:penicillin-binding protein 2